MTLMSASELRSKQSFKRNNSPIWYSIHFTSKKDVSSYVSAVLKFPSAVLTLDVTVLCLEDFKSLILIKNNVVTIETAKPAFVF